jgi:hypothetical protein
MRCYLLLMLEMREITYSLRNTSLPPTEPNQLGRLVSNCAARGDGISPERTKKPKR